MDYPYYRLPILYVRMNFVIMFQLILIIVRIATSRKELFAFTDTQALFVMTQQTVKNGQAINFSHNQHRNQVISDYLFKSLPEVGRVKGHVLK